MDDYRRQSQLVATTDAADPDLDGWVDAALADLVSVDGPAVG